MARTYTDVSADKYSHPEEMCIRDSSKGLLAIVESPIIKIVIVRSAVKAENNKATNAINSLIFIAF